MSNVIAQVGLAHGSGFEVVDGVQYLSAGSKHNALEAAQLLYKGNIEHVVCSGHGPLYDEAYPLTEADLMANYLLNIGVRPAQVEIEGESGSTMGNWANSVPMIKEMGAESVLGITAKPNIPRMHRIGDFITAKSDLELVGYQESLAPGRMRDYAREFVMDQITKRFIKAHQNTDTSELEVEYEAYKAQFGLAAVKRYVHRGSTGLDSSN